MESKVKTAIASWEDGGQGILSSLLTSSLSDPIASHLILYTLLRHSQFSIPKESLVTFLQSISSPPSTSSSTPSTSTSTSPPVSLLSEHLADALWQADAELEDTLVAASSGSTPLDPKVKAGLDKEKKVWNDLCKALFGSKLVPVPLWDRFDFAFLEKVGASIGTGTQTMIKKSTRLGTVTFFSLKKYNLLRESSEGFSLLIILLTSRETLGPGSNPETGFDREDSVSRKKRAKEVWKRVMGIIGYFDLDPSRTLDLIFDAFISSLLVHHRFFIDLLHCSAWSSPPSSEVINSDKMDLAGESGSSVAAQVLGFKFKHYQDQTVMRSGQEAPKEMVLMAAILIREGLVKLKELWEHLSPNESEMAKHESRHRSAVNQLARNSIGNALLASAAPLVDDEPTPSSSLSNKLPANPNAPPAAAAPPPPPLPDLPLPDQKIALFTSLLAVGASAQITYLLTRFPHLPNAYPEIADLQLRNMTYTLAPLLEKCSPFVPEMGKGKAKGGKKTLTLIAPPPLETDATEWVYFYPEWEEQVGRIESVDELFEDEKGVNRALRSLGALVGRDARMLVSLIRLAVKDIQDHPTDPTILPRWSLPIRLIFLPSLSLLGGSPTSHEIWSLLSLYPVPTRYGFYGSWKTSYSDSLQLKVQGAIAERDTKAVLRRVSKDDLKLHARSLGKLSHSDPTIVWGVVLRQIQSYDNLVKPVVESARFITPLGADVLIFVLLDAFSNPAKERTKVDGTSVSLWLKSLAAFAGELCRRYHLAIDHKPIFQYVANQLRAGSSKDLIILRELLSAMTGIDPLANLSDTQVSALGGGPNLRGEAVNPTVPTSKPPPQPGVEMRTQAPVEKRGLTTKSAPTLVASLEEEKMTLPLLIVVAQTRDRCLFTVPDEEAHMKHLSTLFDSSTEVFLQYVEFLVQSIGPEKYADLIPSFTELATNYDLPPALAFHILRPKLSHAVKVYDLKMKTPAETPAAKEARLRQELKESKKPVTPVPSPPEIVVSSNGVVVAGEIEGVDSDTARMKKFHPLLIPVISEVSKYFPNESIKFMGAPFFVTFWQLSPYDIEVPLATYQHEIERLLKADKELSRYPSSAQNTDEWRADKARVNGKVTVLTEERNEQMELYAATRRRLGTEKMLWFRKFPDCKIVNQQVYQHCIYPRVLLSLEDAAFCAKFIKMMHSMGTQNFASLWYHDGYTFTEWMAPLLSALTENEARNYARYVHDCLQDLMPWQEDEDKYIKEACGVKAGEKAGDKESVLPGFRAKLLRQTMSSQMTKEELLPWNGYRKVMHKWHKRLTAAFETCVDSKEYMHIKNVVILLQKILPFFPREAGLGEQMEKKLKSAIADETREDLKLLLQSYSSQMAKLKPKWIPITQFRAPEVVKAGTPRSAAASPLVNKTVALAAESTPISPSSPLARADTPARSEPTSATVDTPASVPQESSKPKVDEDVKPKPVEVAPSSVVASSKPVEDKPVVAATESKDSKPVVAEKPLPSGPKALVQQSNGSSSRNGTVKNESGSIPTGPSNGAGSSNGKSDSKKEDSSVKKENGKPAAAPSSRAPPASPSSSGMRSERAESSRTETLRSDALSTKELPKGPRAQQSSLHRQTSASGPARTLDMQPPAGPSSTRDAVDVRSSSSTKPSTSSRDRSPPPSRTSGGRDRATPPSRSSRRRSRTPPPAKNSRSGSVESSHSTRSGSRRTVDKESEKDREDRKLADRESTLNKSRLGGGGDDRDRERDRGDRNGDRDRDPRRTSGGRNDRDPRDPRGSDRRNESFASSRRGRDNVGGRDTPPHSRARSPHNSRDERDPKRLKTDKELPSSSSSSRRRSASPPRIDRSSDKNRKSRDPRDAPKDKSSSSSLSRDVEKSERGIDRDPRDSRSRREREPSRTTDRTDDRDSRHSSSSRSHDVPSSSTRLSDRIVPVSSSGLPLSSKFGATAAAATSSSSASTLPERLSSRDRDPPPHAVVAETASASSEDRKRNASQLDDSPLPDGKKSRIVRNHRYALDNALKDATGSGGTGGPGGGGRGRGAK